jgi:nucleoside phosphorylase
MVASAVLTSNMINTFRPRVVAMTGVCAGFKERTEFGDVVIADPSWDYQSGKITSAEFEVAPHQIALNPAIRRRLAALSGRDEVLRRIRSRWVSGNAPQTEIRVHIGPFASGSAVLAKQDRIKEVKAQHRHLVAVDMEVYGLYAAAAEASSPVPHAVAMKGVQDFGDEMKADDYRNYAAFVSASLFAEFVSTEYLDLLELWS